MIKTWLKILEEAGWPNVYLLSPQQFEHVEGDKIHGDYEISAVNAPAIVVNRGLRGKVLANSIWHGLGHQLFKSKRHWWIYLYAYIMAKGGLDGEHKTYSGHTVDDMPNRDRLLHLTRLSSARLNAKSYKSHTHNF